MTKQTIAQRLGIKDFPFKIKDKDGNLLYYEDSDGKWYESTYDENGNELIYKNSDGYWYEYTYDENGNPLAFKDSDGDFIESRKKEVSMDEIANKFGIPVNQLKIKKD